MDFETRFWAKVSKLPTGCWVWTAAKLPKGYGVFGRSGFSSLAHRVSYEITNGEIPKGLMVCHHCDNPSFRVVRKVRNIPNPSSSYFESRILDLDGSVPNEQFSGRLNRIGQKEDVIVRYRLIAKETLDDDHYTSSVLAVKARRSEVDIATNSW